MIVIMSEELIDYLRSFPSRRRDIPASGLVFERDMPVRSLFVVDRGAVELRRFTEGGNVLVLQRAIDHAVLAEASLYSDCYHCDAVAIHTTRLLVISKPKLKRAMLEDQHLANLWGTYLSACIQNARQRAEILSRRSVAERLDGWLSMKDARLPAKGQWKQVAAEIGVTPEALYRELARRR